MTYLTIKYIKGNPYLYEVRSEREGDRVRQVFVRYLGRADRTERESVEVIPVARKERTKRPAVIATTEVVEPTVTPAPEVTKLESARNEIQRELEYAQKRVSELRQVLKEKGGTREKRIWNNNELGRQNTLVAEYGRLLRENNPEELIRYVPKEIPVVIPKAEITSTPTPEEPERVKPELVTPPEPKA